MPAFAAEAGTFLEGLEDSGRPVNWLHLTLATIVIGVTAYGLSVFAQLLSQ